MSRETSINAYSTIKNSGLLSKRRWEVYDVVCRKGPITANEVFVTLQSEQQGPSNAASNSAARFSELRELGVLKEVGTKECSVTGMNVILWDVEDVLPKEFTQREKLLLQIKKAEERLISLKLKLVELDSDNESN